MVGQAFLPVTNHENPGRTLDTACEPIQRIHQMVKFEQFESDNSALSLCNLQRPEGLVDLLNHEKKSDAIKAAKQLTLCADQLASLTYYASDLGYNHKMLRWIRTPDQLQTLPTSYLDVSGPELGPRMAEFFERLQQIRKDGRHLIAHLFTSKSDFCWIRNGEENQLSFKWHVFYSDLFSEMAATPASCHFKDGAHVHYASHLWNIPRTDVVRRLALPEQGRNEGISGSVHVKFQYQLYAETTTESRSSI